MNVTRVQQILQAEEKIRVTYQGVPVWIDGLEANRQMARVHPEGNPQDTKTVSLDQLSEQ